jgi:hypothetical protein
VQGKTLQKIGWVVFGIGALYMLGMGWLYSWWMVPAANEIGPDAMSGAVGFIWALSAPLGSVLVAVGAALIAQVERRLFWSLLTVGILQRGFNHIGPPRSWLGLHLLWPGDGTAG